MCAEVIIAEKAASILVAAKMAKNPPFWTQTVAKLIVWTAFSPGAMQLYPMDSIANGLALFVRKIVQERGGEGGEFRHFCGSENMVQTKAPVSSTAADRRSDRKPLNTVHIGAQIENFTRHAIAMLESFPNGEPNCTAKRVDFVAAIADRDTAIAEHYTAISVEEILDIE